MSIKTDAAVAEHEARIKALETAIQMLKDENKLLHAALDNRDTGPDRTLRLKPRAA